MIETFSNKKEIEIILEIIRGKGSFKIVDQKGITGDFDWQKFTDLSYEHGVLPIVFNLLEAAGFSGVPDVAVKELREKYDLIRHLNILLSKNLITILGLLDKNNINVIPVKGPALSVLSYGDIGFRTYQDLDILVRPSDFISLYETLEREGFRPSSFLSDKKKKLWKRFRRDIEFFKSGINIDVHQRMVQGHSAFDLTEEMFTDKHKINILECDIHTLSPEYSIILHCVNSARDRWKTLGKLADLSYLIYNNPDINWESVIRESKRMGVLRIVLSGMELLKRILGDDLPEIVQEKILKDNKIGLLAAGYSDSVLSGTTLSKTSLRVGSFFRSLDSPFFKLKFILYYLFTPTPEDFRSLSLPEFLYPLYYLLRPLRLLKLSLFDLFT